MAIFGAQIVITMVVASFLQKLCPIYSFGRWLLCKGGLIRYLHPSDKEIHRLMGKTATKGAPPKGKGKQPRSGYDNQRSKEPAAGDEVFSIPRTLDVRLTPFPVSMIDAMQLKFYNEFVWLLDFTLCTILVVMSCDLHSFYFPSHSGSVSLHVVWCALTAIFAFRILLSLTHMYTKTEDSSELVLVAISGFFFFVLAMGVLIVDEEILEFGIGAAHANFSQEAAIFLEQQGITSIGPMSALTLKSVLVVAAAVVGSLLYFPGLRYARTYRAALVYAQARPILQLLLHLDFLSPLLCIALWVRPIARNIITNAAVAIAETQAAVPIAPTVVPAVINPYVDDDDFVTEDDIPPTTAPLTTPAPPLSSADDSSIKSSALDWLSAVDYYLPTSVVEFLHTGGGGVPHVSDEQFEVMRVFVCLLALALRASLARVHYQAHLNHAQSVLTAWKREAGKSTNRELQMAISRPFYWLVVVATQHAVPLILSVTTLLLLKSLGDLRWSSLGSLVGVDLSRLSNSTSQNATSEFSNYHSSESNSDTSDGTDSMDSVTEGVSLALSNLRNVFSPLLWRAVLGFAVWWAQLAWFMSATFGALYYTYIVE